jgi:hypothetical protein
VRCETGAARIRESEANTPPAFAKAIVQTATLCTTSSTLIMSISDTGDIGGRPSGMLGVRLNPLPRCMFRTYCS